ncbi:MAG: hypothetical protein EXQ95_08370 [Alphaproteobacteria bacterium]|nr:hypothetical protein [Alphaproteobacteria bacterium]
MRRAAVLLVLTALGGCADGLRTMTYEYPQTVNSARVNLHDAAVKGPMLLEVRDNPFGGDVARPLAEAASETSVGFKVRFVTERSQAANADTRLVVQFSPASGVSSAEVCDPSRAVAKAPDPVQLSALVAFCAGARPIISMTAVGARPERPDAPVIRNLAEQAMIRMFSSSTSLHESPGDYWPD